MSELERGAYGQCHQVKGDRITFKDETARDIGHGDTERAEYCGLRSVLSVSPWQFPLFSEFNEGPRS